MRPPRRPLVLGATLVAAGAVLLPASDSGVLKTVRRPHSGRTAAWREGEVIVSFRAGTPERDIERALREGGVARVRRSRQPMRTLATLEPGITVGDAVRRFAAMPEVDYAEPNGVVRKSQGRVFRPNDPLFEFQWNMEMVGAERTWAIQQGSSTVGVAVIDTGIAYEDYDDPVTGQSFRRAPDWGSVVFLPGFDFVNDDSHPNDDEFHGTHVASTIAEASNNNVGVTGLAFGVSLMPVKVLDEEGFGAFFDVAEGIDYAVDFSQGETRIKVINMSLGTDGTSETIRRAVGRAVAAGIVVVAAAGNEGLGTVEFPANLPEVIAVGALDARKQRAVYSNSGVALDLVAPGGDCDRDDTNDDFGDCVFQQMPDPDFVLEGRYDQFCYCGIHGTSMATPHVAAAAALLFSQGITDASSVRAALEQTAERLGGAPEGGRNDTYGNGLIRPAAALTGLGFNLGPPQ